MVAKNKLVSEEVDSFCNRTPRKCGRGTLSRIIAISVIVFVALIMSLIYYGIALERMDTFRQIMALKLRHQHQTPLSKSVFNAATGVKLLPVDTVELTQEQEQQQTTNSGDEDDNNSIERSLHLQHLQMKYFRRRFPRDLTKLMEPLFIENGPDFERLYAKVRDKRTKLEISKLEKEYVRCKKEFVNGNDCMVAFVKMYNLAKEISKKMEKMKAIFKDSEFLLKNGSSSTSEDTREDNKATNSTSIVKDLEAKEKDLHKNETLNLTTEIANTTTITTTTTTEKLEPIKISWIIDGNEDFDYNFKGSAEQKKTIDNITQIKTNINETVSTLTKTTTLKPMKISLLVDAHDSVELLQNTTVKTRVLVTTTTTGASETSEHFDETTDTTATWNESTTLEDETTTETNSEATTIEDKTNSEATTNGDKTSTDILTTESEPTESDIIEDLRKLKFGWIIDGKESIAEESDKSDKTTNIKATTEGIKPQLVLPATLKPIKFSWIIDSDLNAEILTDAPINKDRVAVSEEDIINIEQFETTTPTTFAIKLDDMTTSNANIDATFSGQCNTTSEILGICNINAETNHTRADAHPLDYPSSLENMLDSSEGFKLIIHENKTKEQSSTTKNPNERKDWHEKFNQDTPQEELIDTFGSFDQKSMKMAKFGPKLNPANANGFGDTDIEFMTLCERVAKRMRNKQQANMASKPDSSQLENHTQPPVQFTSRGPGGFPVTGETMKASAQFMYNPSFAMMPPYMPVCFFVTPASFRMPSYGGMSYGGMYGGLGNVMGGGGGNLGGMFFMPQNLGTTGNFFSHPSGTASGGSQGNIPNIFSKNDAARKQQQQFYCSYMQNQANNQNQGGGGNGGLSFSNANFKMRHTNKTSSADVIYASYAGLPDDMALRTEFKCELPGEVACYGGHECVRVDSWCNGSVECSDGSDEAACTCRDRLLSLRLCDGYADCPMGEDEVGCFGCGDFMYSCYNSVAEYEHFNRSTISMCFSKLEKCDGFINCLNGKDELDCSIIVNDVSHHMSHSASTSEGFLYHNHRGEWYPVCNNGEIWAKQACSNEETSTIGFTNVTFRELSLPGPFIEPLRVGQVHFPQSCQKRENQNSLVNHVTFVKCASPKCGVTKKVTPSVLRGKSKRSTTEVQLKSQLDERIVGGSYSKPLQWPFVVALYRNGNFHCGGTIFSELWIISAAHCVINYQKYYYEARAGVFRRSSYAVSTQIQPISHVVVHQAYERRSMRNDLALLRMAEPLQFNRWIKPICLPDIGRTTNDRDWMFGPTANTLCTAVGWGAIREKGPGSDQLREVTLPIRRNCTDKDDILASDICAGDAEGGRDACQGDSGGPLFCRSIANADEWYLAGVVSHGNGCARAGEFGVYTRVSLYINWIERSVRAEFQPQLTPLQLCPGFICVWGGKRCISQRKRCDRNVDCLGGEDEVGCIYNFIPDVGSARNGTKTTTESDYFPEYEKATITSFERELVSMASTDVSTQIRNEHVKDIKTDEVETFVASGTTQIFHSVVPETTETILSQTESAILALFNTTEGVSSTSSDNPKNIQNITVEQTEKTTQNVPLTETTLINDEVYEEFTTIASTTQTKEDANSTEMATTTSKLMTGFTTEVPTTISDFSGFKANADTAASPKQHTIVQKRENATEISSLANKFVCQKIPQIVELSHRCDRIVDCEDGTDEEDCNCRDYLKGSLKILICDGKTDCDDQTDEENCGNCKTDEFLCPLSKTCLPLAKRCDNNMDCQFMEDEKDCFALTNGKEIFLDANKQPEFTNMGIFSRNVHGVWRIVCSRDTNFHKHSVKTAVEVCALLGFKSYIFYNTTEALNQNQQHVVPIDPDMKQPVRLNPHLDVTLGDSLQLSSAEHKFPLPIKAKPRTLRIEQRTDDSCLGLFLECQAKSVKVQPMKTISAGVPVGAKELNSQKLRPTVKSFNRPNVHVKPQKPTLVIGKEEEIMDKLDKVIEHKKNLTVMVDNQLHAAIEELHWPWLVDIYMNGSLWCIGVLVDENWIMVHETCNAGLRFGRDYVAALFGGSKTRNKLHKSMHEQIRRIDCHEIVKSSDVLLYHLEQPVQITHYVLPTFLPDFADYNNSDRHECISALHDYQTGRVKTVAIVEHKNDNLCKHSDMSCYQLLARKPPITLLRQTELSAEDLSSISEEVQFKSEEAYDNDTLRTLSKFTNCKQFGVKADSRNVAHTPEPSDQGVLVCRSKESSGWYPTALFAYNNTDCSSFKQPFGIRTLVHAYNTLQEIIEQAKCTQTPPPICNTLRCPLGACLEEAQICNEQVDCHDSSDELKQMCVAYKKSCQPSEMKCRSSQRCIPKTKFCDHVVDCEDLTDEPTFCSCFTYLKATDPAKICDGIRNCWDKSDESPALCNCTANHFRCGGGAKECIPSDFVCDKEPDCPNGEDEKYCYGIEHPLNEEQQQQDQQVDKQHWTPKPTPFSRRPPQYGQVIEQTYGVWHTKCFPRDTPPDVTEVRLICKKLGYNAYRLPSFRLIDNEVNEAIETYEAPDQRGRNFGIEPLIGKYRDATKAVVVSKFSPLRLNDELTLFMKPSRPIAELMRWNATDSSKCLRLEIKCA